MEMNCAKLTQELQLRCVRFRSMLFEICEKISEKQIEGLWFIYGASEGEEEVDLTKGTVVFDVLVKSKKVEDERESLLALKSVLTEKLHNQNVGPIIDKYLEKCGVYEQTPATSEVVYPAPTNRGSGTVVPPFNDSDSFIVDTEASGESQKDDAFFMAKADKFGQENSEDPQSKVGAVIVQGGKIVAEGTNRMPKNCTGKFPWSREGKSKLDTKYPYVIHASILALMTALKEGQKTDGATIYTTIFPGHVDAQLMVECGIKEVVFGEVKHPEEAYVPAASQILKEAGVKFRVILGKGSIVGKDRQHTVAKLATNDKMDTAFASLLECFRLSGIKRHSSRRLLGQGAYGFVEEYTYRELRCAGKKLMPVLREGTTKEQEQAQLKNAVKECEVLSKLKHPNIVQFLGVHFDEDDPIPILIMEYVPYTLSGFLDKHKHGDIPLEITYGILVDVAQVLCYLHGGDPVIIHRDLSANNILLTTDLRAKVSDLGTARILDVSVREKIKRCQKMTTCPGTPVYMPPEARLEKASYNENIDCYSYGVLILHVLNRDWPVPAESIRNEDHQVVVLTDIDRRQEHIDKIDANHPLRGLILRCLDHKDKRPTAKEIFEKVQAVQKQCCKAESDRMFLLIQQRLDSEKKAALEKQIDELQSERQKQIDQLRNEMERKVEQLNNEVKTNKYLYSEEVKKMAAEVEGLKSVNEGLKSMMDIKTIELEALKEHKESISEMLRKKEDEINDAEVKLRTYQEQKDGEIKEILHKKKEEIDTIKKDAEEKLHTCQEERDEEIASIKKDAKEKRVAYEKQLNDRVIEKEKEMNAYGERLRKKEEIIEAAIQRDTERAQKAHEALHKSRSEQGTLLEYLRSGTQMHPLHHRARHLKWREGPSLPMGMTAPQCVLIKSSLYVGGGQTVSTEKDSRNLIFEYDTSEDNGERWKCPFLPSPTVYFGLGELNEKLVIVGGEREAEDKRLFITGDVFVLVDGGTSWTSDVIPPLKKPRIRSCVISYKGCIAACGGLEDGTGNTRKCSSVVEVYRSEGREWCTITSLPVPRAALRISIIHKTAYFLGGFYPDLSGPGKANCMSVELEDLFQDDMKSQRKWRDEFQDCPYESSTPASLCGSLIAVGGVDHQASSHTKAIYAYSPAMNKWHLIDELPIKLSTATAVTLTSGELVVLGGKLKGGRSTSDKDRNKDVYIGSLE